MARMEKIEGEGEEENERQGEEEHKRGRVEVERLEFKLKPGLMIDLSILNLVIIQ